ncbi:hypothetical protein ACP4OV_018344 [Aristida adscensionis]
MEPEEDEAAEQSPATSSSMASSIPSRIPPPPPSSSYKYYKPRASMASPSAPPSFSSSVRQRPAAAVSAPQPPPQLQDADQQQSSQKQDDEQQAAPWPAPAAPSSALSQALASTASLANLLPTGTLLAFNLLAPTFTNHGACDGGDGGAASLLTGGLLAVLALSCALACFTDSLRGPDGRVYYGVATPRGLWLLDYPPGAPPPPAAGAARYRLAPVDFVHAALSVAVFGVVAARDRNVVRCFWPAPARATAEALDVLPLGVGVLCSLLFVAFPTRRHGIGYPVTNGAGAGAGSSS